MTAASEKAFQAQIVDLARTYGWWVYHTHDSRNSAAGWPDLACVRDRILFVELKTDTGILRPDQVAVHDRLARAGHPVVVLRPKDFHVAVHLFRTGELPDG